VRLKYINERRQESEMKPKTGSGKLTLSSKKQRELLVDSAQKASEYAKAARSENTLRAYRSSWNDFENWCTKHGEMALPAVPMTVAMYLSDRADKLKLGTLGHRLAAITVAHKLRGFPNPASKREEPLQSVWKGIANKHTAAKKQVEPILKSDLKKMIAKLQKPETDTGRELRRLRDRALLLFGFAGALRRSELSAMKVNDLQSDVRGMKLSIRQSKTDQTGEGDVIGIPATGTQLCPVTAVNEWLDFAGISEGNVFRSIRHGPVVLESVSTKSIANIIKKHVAAAGLDPTFYSGHSLRSGLITQAAQQGASELDIMRHSRHRSVPVLRQYVRKATVWQDNAAVKALG